jgi:putative membrane protein
MIQNLGSNIAGAAIFAVLGIVILALVLLVFHKLTPGLLWKELMEDQNTALAIVMAGITIGISIIIASAVH